MSDQWKAKEKDDWMIRVNKKKNPTVIQPVCGCKIVEYTNEEGAIVVETDYCTLHGLDLGKEP